MSRPNEHPANQHEDNDFQPVMTQAEFPADHNWYHPTYKGTEINGLRRCLTYDEAVARAKAWREHSTVRHYRPSVSTP